jgi:sortase B
MSFKRKRSHRKDSLSTDAPLAAASEEIKAVRSEAEEESEIILPEDAQRTEDDASNEEITMDAERDAPSEADAEAESIIFTEAEESETAAKASDDSSEAETGEAAAKNASDGSYKVAADENGTADEKDESADDAAALAENAAENAADAEAVAEAEKSPEGGKKKPSILVTILKWVQNIILIICAAVFLVCLYLLGQNLYEKYRGNQIYSDADSAFNNVIPGETDLLDINPQYMERPVAERTLATMYDRLIGDTDNSSDNVSATVLAQLEMMRSSLSELIAVNSDVCGWIYAPGTKINYPIARGTDNVYYLSHDYTKQYLAVGTPFVDCENDQDLSKNLNTVIYGHNVYNGSMFHDIEKFKSKDFFDSAKVYIYTMDGIYVYTPCSIYSTKDYYQYFRVQFNDDEDFISFTREMISNSMIKSNITFQPGDQMLTLSTCTNNIEGDGRYALHLKMTEFITDKTEDSAETGAE